MSATSVLARRIEAASRPGHKRQRTRKVLGLRLVQVGHGGGAWATPDGRVTIQEAETDGPRWVLRMLYDEHACHISAHASLAAAVREVLHRHSASVLGADELAEMLPALTARDAAMASHPRRAALLEWLGAELEREMVPRVRCTIETCQFLLRAIDGEIAVDRESFVRGWIERERAGE